MDFAKKILVERKEQEILTHKKLCFECNALDLLNRKFLGCREILVLKNELFYLKQENNKNDKSSVCKTVASSSRSSLQQAEF